MPRTIAFLSDYGHRDPCVGICHAVVKRIASDVPIFDLTHGIAPQDIRAGAIALADAVAFLPRHAVVFAVVDPGVGGERRAVAVDGFDGISFVGPDNGLLAPAIALAGGAETVVEISNSKWCLDPLSNTFHGRDMFAPVAARLAAGENIADGGQALAPEILVQLELPRPEIRDGIVRAEALDIDVFGNVRLAAAPTDLHAAGISTGSAIEIDFAGLRTPARFVNTFTDVDLREPLLFEDSNGSIAIAVNQGNAAQELGLRRGACVQIIAT